MYYSFFLLSFILQFIACVVHKNEFWWDSAVIYNVYPKSFKDANDDGVGDLKGVIEKLPYIKSLGVDAIYINPVCVTQMKDNGYDISDFKAIDPVFGTMSDMENLIKESKKFGLKLIIDFVPNHTSEKHEWFLKSVDRIDPYTDYYHWRNASGYTKDKEPLPPNNWLSVMVGVSSWEWNDKRKQFYYHTFLKEQPDLNFGNERVIEETKSVLQFWLDKDIDGIRVDAVQHLYENLSCPDEEMISPDLPRNFFWSYKHDCRKDRPENAEFLKKWRDVVSSHSRATDGRPRLIMVEYLGNEEGSIIHYEHGADIVYHNLLIAISYNLLNANKVVNYLRNYTTTWAEKKFTMHWQIGTHDLPRSVTIFGEELADSLNMVMLLLPGNTFWYNGEELGMHSYTPRILQRADGSRTVFQWDSTFQAGFSRSNSTWLPVNSNYYRQNVKAELQDPESDLNFFKKLVQLRKEPEFKSGEFEIVPISERVCAFTRYVPHVLDKKFICVVNLGKDFEYVSIKDVFPGLPDTLYIHMTTPASEHFEGEKINKAGVLTLRPHTSVLLSTTNPAPSKSSVVIASSLVLYLGCILISALVNQIKL